MKRLIAYSLFLGLALPCSAQYAGGSGGGFAVSTVTKATLFEAVAIYGGGDGDGFVLSTKAALNLFGSVAIYGGGSGDGFGTMSANTLTLFDAVSIYGGGDGDGFSLLSITAQLVGPSTLGLLNFVEVLRQGGTDGSGTSLTTLTDLRRLAASADGKHLYTASSDDDAMTVFSRDSHTFRLTHVEAENPVGMDSPEGVAVSPDGLTVYATSQRGDALLAFSRDSTSGVVNLIQTIFNGVSPTTLLSARGIAVSPDNKNVYVASSSSDAVVVFSRDIATGMLTVVENHINGASGVSGLNGARRLTISPDGTHVYVASSSDDALVTFSRNSSTGRLTFVEALFDGGTDSSAQALNNLNGAGDVEVSPDGQHVYLTGRQDDALNVFSRNASTGRLTLVESLMHGGTDQASTTLTHLEDPRGLTFNASGASLLVVASTSNAVTVFDRDANTGRLTQTRTYTDQGTDASGGTIQGLLDPYDVIYVSGSVYVASSDANAVVVFSESGDQSSLPVELTSFRLLRDAETLHLTWETASETNNAGFEIQHRISGLFVPLAYVEGAGTTTTAQTYSYTLPLPMAGTHTYRLKQTDYDGTTSYSAPQSITVPLTQPYQLSSPYPNPFSQHTTFTLTLQAPQNIGIYLHDMLGRRIRTVFKGRLAAHQRYTFRLVADNLSSGMYISQIFGETFSTSHTVMHVK